MTSRTKEVGKGRARLVANRVCLVSFLLYTLSFVLPTFEIVVDGKHSVSYGYDAFVISLFSLASPFFGGLRSFAAWLANPVLWFGIHRFVTARCSSACVAGILATALAATLMFGEGDRNLILVGYYLWWLSMGIFVLAAALKWTDEKAPRSRRSWDWLMNVNGVLQLLHATSALIACSVFCLSPSFASRNGYTTLEKAAFAYNAPTFAAVAFLTGLGAMAGRKGESESIWLAVSTVAAFLLLALCLLPRVY